MPNKPSPSLYWDSCVFLDRLKRRADRIALLEAITDAAAAGDFLIVTSAVTLAEVIRLADVGPTTPTEVKTIEDFFENPWINVRIVDEVIAKSAAELRRVYRIRTCDALHVATALRYQVPVFHTYDGLAADGTIKPAPFLLAFNGVLGGDPKLRIEVPSAPNPRPPPPPQMQMFTPPTP